MVGIIHRSGQNVSMVAIINEILVIFVGYLRLGCMARDRGQIYEASDWFKEALQINQVNCVICNNIF